MDDMPICQEVYSCYMDHVSLYNGRLMTHQIAYHYLCVIAYTILHVSHQDRIVQWCTFIGMLGKSSSTTLLFLYPSMTQSHTTYLHVLYGIVCNSFGRYTCDGHHPQLLS